MESIWQRSASPITFDALKGDKTTDVLIVGGGIAGLLCADRLTRAGVECVLVEADRICGGVTGCTTAKITLGHGLIYDKLINQFGEEKARLYVAAQMQAGEEYARLCRNIDCDYERIDSYVYAVSDRQKIEREVDALNRLGVDAEFSDARELPIEVAGAVRVKNQAQFGPLRFLYKIAEGLPIYEHTKVIEFASHRAVTNRGTIRFNKMIVATHFPIFNKHGAYFLKLYQHRSYVLALEGARLVEGMYVDASDAGLSFRSCGDVLLLGGGGHRTGKQGGCWQELESFAREHYKNARIVGKWATQDCMTLDGVPYIGQYARSTRGFYVATGFNKWGMTNAMVAADILCDLVRDKPNPYAAVFSPSRSVLYPQLAINALESVSGLLRPTAPRCPHLGCALRYNRAEHTWDCPCHGSRFTERGELIDNPATDDMKQ